MIEIIKNTFLRNFSSFLPDRLPKSHSDSSINASANNIFIGAKKRKIHDKSILYFIHGKQLLAFRTAAHRLSPRDSTYSVFARPTSSWSIRGQVHSQPFRTVPAQKGARKQKKNRRGRRKKKDRRKRMKKVTWNR